MGSSTGRAQFNRRVLVIDDQPSIHEDFRKILVGDAAPVELDAMEAAVFGTRVPEPRKIRFEVDSAYQGAEAIEKIRQAHAEKRPYALAFIDVRMPPGFDGVETLSLIFEEDQDIQAVLCTAYSDWSWSAMAEKLDNEGRFLILKKPFDAAEVRQIAAAMTMKWSEQAALHAAYRRQELLHAATRLIVRATSPASCASALVELIGTSLGWPFVALWDCVDAANVQCLGAYAGGQNAATGELRAQSLSMEEGARVLPKESITSSTFVAAPNSERDERAALATNAGLGGALLVPVRAGEQVLAILELWRESSVAPDRGEVSLMEELCSRLVHFLDRAHMLASFAQREASLRALLLALPDRIYHVDRVGNTLTPLSERAENTTNLLDVVPQYHHDRILEVIANAMDSGSVLRFDFTSADGQRTLNARIAPVHEKAAIVVLRDVT